MAGYDVAAHEKGNPPGYVCHKSWDIDGYDTCPHGRVDCCAVARRSCAQLR